MSQTHVPAELRRAVRQRPKGRCEYCHISEEYSFALHEVDHVIAEKHTGETTMPNLALCCTLCNRRKGSDLALVDPETRDTVFLFNPRKDVWQEHFQSRYAFIEPLTAKGRATARLLGFNLEARIAERLASIS